MCYNFLYLVLFFFSQNVYSLIQEESIQESLSRISNQYLISFKSLRINNSIKKYNIEDVILLSSIKQIENYAKFLSSANFETEYFSYYKIQRNRLNASVELNKIDTMKSDKKYSNITYNVNFKFNHNTYGKLIIQPTFDFSLISKSFYNIDLNIEEKSNFYSVKLINTLIEDKGDMLIRITYNIDITFYFIGSIPITDYIYTGMLEKKFSILIEKKTGKILNSSIY